MGGWYHFSEQKTLKSNQPLVFISFALTVLGVGTFLTTCLKFAPAISDHKFKDDSEIEPLGPESSSFVFKI